MELSSLLILIELFSANLRAGYNYSARFFKIYKNMSPRGFKMKSYSLFAYSLLLTLFFYPQDYLLR